MKSLLNGRWATVAYPGLILGLLCIGCGKEETPPPAAAAPVAETEAAPPPEAVTQTGFNEPVPVAEEQVQLQQLDERLQNNDYEGAVDVLLRAQLASQQQQATLTAQQRMDQHNRMRQVQKQIADAMASGDPNAQRAAQLLMQYNAARTHAR